MSRAVRYPVKRVDALAVGDMFKRGSALHEVLALGAAPDAFAVSIVTANGATFVLKRYESVEVLP